MNNRRSLIGLALAALALVLAVGLPPQTTLAKPLLTTVTLQPNAAAGEDTYIDSSNATTNFFDGSGIFAGESNGGALVVRGLIQFDLSGIPAGSTINSATLSLFVTTDLADNGRTFRLYRVKRNWVENQATWNIFSTGNSWGTAGGFNVSDAEATDIGSRALAASESLNTFLDWTLSASAVQEMIPGGSWTNNGFLLKVDTETNDAYGFASSDNATAARWPKLVIDYSPPTATPTATATDTPTPTHTPTATHTPTPTATPLPIEIASDGYADARINPSQYRWNNLTSVSLDGTVYQALSYWDTDGYLVLGARETLAGSWTFYTYDGSGGRPTIETTLEDNHNVANIGLDPEGYLHVSYDMHGVPLLYRRSDAPLDSWTGVLTAELDMTASNEDKVTYPTFLNDPAGNLYFLFRNNTNYDDGFWYFYKYDHAATSWAAAAGTSTGGLLISDTGAERAYIFRPSFDANFGAGGYFHLAWSWRRYTPVENHSIGYARWDGTTWSQADGSAQTVPITLSNQDTVDAVDSPDLTSLNSLASDSAGFPHLVYPKTGEDGFRHIYHAYHDGLTWTITPITTSEAAPKGDEDTDANLVPSIAIRRSDDTVYVFYVDPEDSDGIMVTESNPGDFGAWSRSELYGGDVGWWGPKYDYAEWERSGTAYFLVEPWEEGAGSLPLYLLSWSPGGGLGGGAGEEPAFGVVAGSVQTPDQHNFWYWFLTGLLDMIDNFMVQLPLYQHSGMAVLFYNALLGVLTVFALYFGTFLNLCWFVAMLILFLTSEGTRGFMAAYRTLVKLIPLP